jgi:hypothetical protein
VSRLFNTAHFQKCLSAPLFVFGETQDRKLGIGKLGTDRTFTSKNSSDKIKRAAFRRPSYLTTNH